MALVTIVLEDSPGGILDLAIHTHPSTDLGPVDRPTDTPAIKMARRVVFVVKQTAKAPNNTQPQEG